MSYLAKWMMLKAFPTNIHGEIISCMIVYQWRAVHESAGESGASSLKFLQEKYNQCNGTRGL